MTKRRGFQRADRVGQQVHQEVARIFLTDISDPRLQGLEITDVDMTPDLRNARIYYTLLEQEDPPAGLEEVLEGVVGFVRSELASRLELKYVPEVQFFFDEAVRRGRRIDELLSNLRDD